VIEEDDCNDGGDTWLDAQLFAESLGGYLAVIGSESENLWIIQNVIDRSDLCEALWLGMTDWGSEGTWYWVNGEPVTYTNWGDGEPNDMGGEDSCAMNGSCHPGEWNDLGCYDDTAMIPALIEVNSLPSVERLSWSTVKTGY